MTSYGASEGKHDMNTVFNAHLIETHMRDLAQFAERERHGREQAEADERDSDDRVWVRLAVPGDAGALLRLAALDSQPLPDGPKLVADLGGELVAAVPLSGGSVIADPFRPTADLVELMRLRAAQLTGAKRRVRRFLPSLARGSSRPARAA